MNGDDPPRLADRALVEALAGGAAPALDSLEAELRRRLADPARRETVRALLYSYAVAAPEYVDERIQAAARHSLSPVDEGVL
jgi:hypothetical protein